MNNSKASNSLQTHAELQQRPSVASPASTLVKAALSSTGLRMAGMFFGFLVGIQLARLLGASGYGLYGIALSVSTFLAVPIELGVPAIVLRDFSTANANGDANRMAGLLRWAFATIGVSSLLVVGAGTIAMLVLAEALAPELRAAIWVGLFVVPLAAVGNVSSAMLRALHWLVSGQLAPVLLRPALFSVLLLCLGLAAIEATPALAMLLGAIAAGLSSAVGATMLLRCLPKAVRTAKAARVSGLLRSAIPISMTNGLSVMQGHFAILALGVLVPAADVGNFRIATSIFVLVGLTEAALTQVSSSLIAQLYSEGRFADLRKLLRSAAWVLLVGTGSLALAFIIPGAGILELLFGPEYREAWLPLAILSIGGTVGSLFGTPALILNMTHFETRVMRASTLSVFALLVLVPALTILFGIAGAAVATTVSLLVWKLLLWRDCRVLVGVNPSLF